MQNMPDLSRFHVRGMKGVGWWWWMPTESSLMAPRHPGLIRYIFTLNSCLVELKTINSEIKEQERKMLEGNLRHFDS